MEPQLFISILTFSLPMFSALVCFGLVCPWRGLNNRLADRKVQRILAVYFLTASFGWFSMLVYPLFPQLATVIQTFIYLSFLLIQLVFYHFVFTVTKFDPAEKFSLWHYFAPALICGTLFVWSFFVPFEVQVYLIENKGALAPGYDIYSRFFLSKIMGRLIFSIIYTFLALFRLLRYRKGVSDFSANEERSSLDWLNILILISFCFLVMPVSAIFTDRTAIYSSWIPGITALLVAVQHGILTYNTLKGNYITLETNNATGRKALAADELIREGKGVCSKDEAEKSLAIHTENPYPLKKLTDETFTQFIQGHKPYLDADLKIPDLAEMLGTNRAYLSSFINTTYGMNFSRYINTLRLEELEHIQNDPNTAVLPLSKQITMAGFGSYRNYKRFKEN